MTLEQYERERAEMLRQLPKLLPCPFCGSNDDVYCDELSAWPLYYRCKCEKCATQGPEARNKQTACDMWNTRAEL